MPYAEVSDVQSLMPSVPLSASSKPSSAQVQQFLTDVQAELDSALVNLGYTVPITGTRAALTVKTIVTYGALARTLMSVAAGRSKPEDIGAKDAEKKYQDYLSRLADPEDLTLELNDAVRTDEQLQKQKSSELESQVQGLTSDEFDSENPEITRDQVF